MQVMQERIREVSEEQLLAFLHLASEISLIPFRCLPSGSCTSGGEALYVQKVADLIMVVQKYEHITELTPEIMHELIEKIIVHAPDKSDGHRTQQIEIHFRFNVAVTTAVADSMKYDKKRKAA